MQHVCVMLLIGELEHRVHYSGKYSKNDESCPATKVNLVIFLCICELARRPKFIKYKSNPQAHH